MVKDIRTDCALAYQRGTNDFDSELVAQHGLLPSTYKPFATKNESQSAFKQTISPTLQMFASSDKIDVHFRTLAVQLLKKWLTVLLISLLIKLLCYLSMHSHLREIDAAAVLGALKLDRIHTRTQTAIIKTRQ